MAAKKKVRATYPKDLRAIAKARQQGLCTVSIEFANGERMEHQAPIDVIQAQFAKWAMAILFCEEVRERPDLESVVRKLMEERCTS